ncbi:hypothetical protein F52700_2289 [Fusarium sp. NRRL 52700]|nr:hypothetical protein F52700_2289 [Fusarium sp. NRRL 52700]
MVSPPSPLEIDEESNDVPLDQLYPPLFGSAGDVTERSKHKVTDCNPMSPEAQALRSRQEYRRLKRSFPLSSSSYGTQGSNDLSSLAPPRIRKSPKKHRPSRKMSVFCPDCGRGFRRMESMNRHREDCRARSENEEEDSMPEAIQRHESPKERTKMEDIDDYHRHLYTLSSPKPEQSHATDRDSSQTPDSDERSSTAETYVDDRKKKIIDSIVLSVMQSLCSKLDVWRKNVGGNSNTASGTPQALLGSHLLAESSNSGNHGNKKSKATQREDHDTNNEDEGGNREHPYGSGISMQGHEDPKFACPYSKYNLAKYKDWRTCLGPGWNDVHRVKYLSTGNISIDAIDSLNIVVHVAGNLSQTSKALSTTRERVSHAHCERWIYEYSQASQNEEACRPESGYLAQCEQYMLREVPQRLRQALGRELDRDLTIVEENLRRRAGDWVKTLLEEAFQELRQIQRLGSPALPPEDYNDIPALPEGGQVPTCVLSSVEGTNLQFEEEGESWLDNFDLDSVDPSSILGELQSSFDDGGLIESLLRSGEDGSGETTKQSDSGYVSNSPE